MRGLFWVYLMCALQQASIVKSGFSRSLLLYNMGRFLPNCELCRLIFLWLVNPLKTSHYVKWSTIQPVRAVLFFPSWGSSGKEVAFHHRLVPLFVALFPNAMIKNNNMDNGVPSTKQWTEIPTSVRREKMAFTRLLRCLPLRIAETFSNTFEHQLLHFQKSGRENLVFCFNANIDINEVRTHPAV